MVERKPVNLFVLDALQYVRFDTGQIIDIFFLCVNKKVGVRHDVVALRLVVLKRRCRRDLERAAFDIADKAVVGIGLPLSLILAADLGESVDHDTEQQVETDEVDNQEIRHRE